MKHYKTGGLALACAISLCLAGCGTGAQVGGAVDRGLDMEGYTQEEEQSREDGQTQESTGGGDVTDINNTSTEGAVTDGLNELGLDQETMDMLKFNIYVQLNNTIVEIMDDISNYFLVVDTAEEFRFREDAEYSYGYRITGFNMDAVEDAEVVYGMAPAFETLDGLVESMLPSMREIMETFNAIDDSEYTYEENQYQQPKDNHIRLMACLQEFTIYADQFLAEIDVIADERTAAQEAKMLEEGRLIAYNFSHMLTLSSQILDQIYDQGIDDYNLTELDLTPIYPLFEEMQETAAAYAEAVSDNNQLMQESLSSRQVYAGDFNGLVQAFEWMIKQVESGVPYEDPSSEYLGGLRHIYEVLSRKVEEYNGIFAQ